MKKRLLLLSLILAAGVAKAQAAPHGVQFTWLQSTTLGITSNTLYCGITAGNKNLKWVFSSPTTAYDWTTTDVTNPPVQGQNYVCAVTASKGGIESGPSPDLTFQFPTVPVSPAGLQRTEH